MLNPYKDLEKNESSAAQERIESLSAAENYNVIQVLSNLEEQEKYCARKVEVLALQFNLLNCLLEDTIALTDIQSTYNQKLDELKTNFLKSYWDLLSQREQIYSATELIQLDINDNRNKFFALYEQLLYKEFNAHATFQFPQVYEEIKSLINELNNQIAIKTAEAEKYLEIKVNLTIRMGKRISYYENCLKKIKQVNQLQQEENDKSFQEMARCGNYEGVRLKLEEMSSFKSKIISQFKISFFSGIPPIDELKDGYNALHLACNQAHPLIVKVLLENGADPTVRTSDESDERTSDGRTIGRTALHLSVEKQHINTRIVIDRLLEKGAKVDDLGPYGQTALHTAVFYRNLSAVIHLINLGANVNQQETDKSNERTPLHIACFKGHLQIARHLLESGADPSLVNKANETPLFEALIAGHHEIVKYFYSKGIGLTDTERELIKEDRRYSGFKLLIDSLENAIEPKTSTFNGCIGLMG